MADYFIVASGGSQNQLLAMQNEVAVSYTHLDVYKRQDHVLCSSSWCWYYQ